MADKAKRSKRQYLDKDGNDVEIEKAVAFSYTDIATGKSYMSPILGNAGGFATMCALFGGATLAGNVHNTWNFEKGEKEPDPIIAIEKRFKLLEAGQWIVRGEGAARGPKWDRDELTKAICAIKAQDPTKVREKLDSDRKYFNAVVRHPKVRELYRKAKGTEAPSDDALAA